MVYHGKVKNGVVVFDEPIRPADGTPVRIEPLDQIKATVRTSPKTPEEMEAARQRIGPWHGPPGELERLLAEVEADREADVRLQREQEERQAG